MTRTEAELARAIGLYWRLPSRLERATATFRCMAAAFIILLLLGLTAAGSGTRWGAAAPVWLALAAVFLAIAILARLGMTTLERRQAEKRRLAELRATARRMRLAAAFASDLVGHLAVVGAMEQSPGERIAA